MSRSVGRHVPERHREGTSLLELMMVMLLIGIMAGIAVPLLRPEKFRLDGAVVVLGSTLNAQQRNSVLRQHNIVLVVDSAASRLRVHYDLDNDGMIDSGELTNIVELGEGVVFGRGSTPARPLSSSTLSLAGAQDGMPALTFRRNGSASEEAIIYLTSGRVRVSGGSFLEDSRAVEIERATGRVRCYSYSSGSWIQTC